LTIQKALNRCAPENRRHGSGHGVVLLVPLVNIVWQFFVVINVAKSLGSEFQNAASPKSLNRAKTRPDHVASWLVAASFLCSHPLFIGRARLLDSLLDKNCRLSPASLRNQQPDRKLSFQPGWANQPAFSF